MDNPYYNQEQEALNSNLTLDEIIKRDEKYVVYCELVPIDVVVSRGVEILNNIIKRGEAI